MEIRHDFSALLPNGVKFYGTRSTYLKILKLWKNS